MQLIGTLEIFGSKFDINGNREFALLYTDHETGKQVTGMVDGGKSDAAYTANHLGGYDRIRTLSSTLPIRQFNRLTKGWKSAGCCSADIAAYIRAELAK